MTSEHENMEQGSVGVRNDVPPTEVPATTTFFIVLAAVAAIGTVGLAYFYEWG